MSLLTCITNATKLGVLSADEAKMLRERYNDLINDGVSNAEARDRMAKQIAAEADQRERAALLTHVAVDKLLTSMAGFRDYAGRVDQATAFLHFQENMGDSGTFIQDAEGLREAIVRMSMSEMKDVLREFKRGAVTGDLRREINPRVKALTANVVREIMGVSTDDPKAKALAKAWEQSSEKLRVRFNEAGGAIGKLQGGYIPQAHDRLALINFGRRPWVDYMMEPGRLDRARMVDQFSGQPLSDSQLRRALETAWDRITTDGFYDADVTAQPQGKGALYTQHMDHRFIHFASPDKWLEYSKRFGNGGDIYAAMMGHIQIMARDIAHMEVFGPNPNRTREFLKQKLRTDAANMLSNETVLAEQTAELKRLAEKLNRTAPEYLALIDKHGEILGKMDALRNSGDAKIYRASLSVRPDQPLGKRAMRYMEAMRQLEKDLYETAQALREYDDGRKESTVTDPAVKAEYEFLIEHMREPISSMAGRSEDRAKGWVEAKIRRADAMWDNMRGGEVGDPVWAARMQSTRNFMSSAMLGSAVISSLTDPSFGQDARLRMGQGFAASNFTRVAIANLKEMITMGNREDAIAAGLGLDSALRVLHRSAREMTGWDHRFWSGYFADRVLTTGLLLPWTQAGKHVFGLDLMKFVGDLADKDWTALPDRTRRAFEGNGIGKADWAQLRQVPKHEGLWIRPTDVAKIDRALSERYLQMIMRETRHGIPEATVNSSSILQGGPAGTVSGELMRSMMQFKGFGMGVLQLHALRVARELGAGDGQQASAAGYAATLFITSTMLGMVAIALKDMKDGRDPRKWLDEKTWLDPYYVGEAILQAGGLGIFGDFIRASDNRMGGGLAGTMGGPMMGKVENLLTIASPKQIGKWASGKEVTSEEELVRFFRSGVVPGSNHWAVAALYQRALMDKIQRMADPKAQQAFNRTINKRMKDYNQGYWWAPGNPSPQRAPDVSRVWSTR